MKFSSPFAAIWVNFSYRCLKSKSSEIPPESGGAQLFTTKHPSKQANNCINARTLQWEHKSLELERLNSGWTLRMNFIWSIPFRKKFHGIPSIPKRKKSVRGSWLPTWRKGYTVRVYLPTPGESVTSNDYHKVRTLTGVANKESIDII